jgi:hypothetical protein
MKAYQVFFTIDGREQECIVIDESEERAKEHISNSYLRIEKITVYPIEDRMIFELGMAF